MDQIKMHLQPEQGMINCHVFRTIELPTRFMKPKHIVPCATKRICDKQGLFARI
jgi:hypothetical protein